MGAIMLEPNSAIHKLYTLLTSRGWKLATRIPLLALHILHGGTYGMLIGAPLSAMYVVLHFAHLRVVEAFMLRLLRWGSVSAGLSLTLGGLVIGVLLGWVAAQAPLNVVYPLFDPLSSRYLCLVIGLGIGLLSLTELTSRTVELKYSGNTSLSMMFAESLLLIQVVSVSVAIFNAGVQ